MLSFRSCPRCRGPLYLVNNPLILLSGARSRYYWICLHCGYEDPVVPELPRAT